MSKITEPLTCASNSSVPKKTVSLKGPRWKVSPEVKKSLKNVNVYILSNGKHLEKNPNYIHYKQLKSEMKHLRKQQCYEHVMDRKQSYEQLITKPSTKLVNQLIKNNKTTFSSTLCLRVGDRDCYLVNDQCNAFAKYYEDLSGLSNFVLELVYRPNSI